MPLLKKRLMVTLTGVIIVIALLSGNNLLCQNKPDDYGKVTPEDFSLKNLKVDTSADAIILFNTGLIKFRVNNEYKDLEYVYTQKTRIRINNKKGLSWANQNYLLHKSGNEEEKLMDIKATTYNLVNNQVVKVKMASSAMFEDELTIDYINESFTLPNVTEGSIIEFSFTVYSPFLYYLPEWFFQYDIPVCYSEFAGLLPEFFEYKYNVGGYLPLNDPQRTTSNETFVFKYKTLPSAGGLAETIILPVDSRSTWMLWSMKDIPAFKAEAFANHEKNYLSALTFELASLRLPNAPIKRYSTNWETLNKRLLESDDFGRQLRNGRFLSDEVTFLKASGGTKLQMINLASDRLRAKVKCNNKPGIYPRQKLKTAYSEGVGSVSEINMLFVLLLREMGIDANPVLLSTRSHGMLMPDVAKLSQLNSIIAHIKIDDQEILADLSQDTYPPGILPAEDINGMGIKLVSGPEQDVDLVRNSLLGEMKSINMSMNTEGSLTGTVNEKYQKQSAAILRARLKKDKKEKIVAAIQESSPNCDIENYTVVNADSIYQPLQLSYSVTLSGAANTAMIYIDPFFLEADKKNPFQLEVREYPIDFICPREETYLFNLTIPEGYKVVEKPETITLVSPDNSAQLIYSCSEMNDAIHIICKLKYARSVYVPSEYADIKEFAKQVYIKKNQKIILQKI